MEINKENLPNMSSPLDTLQNAILPVGGGATFALASQSNNIMYAAGISVLHGAIPCVVFGIIGATTGFVVNHFLKKIFKFYHWN
jgi:hypothetical protein